LPRKAVERLGEEANCVAAGDPPRGADAGAACGGDRRRPGRDEGEVRRSPARIGALGYEAVFARRGDEVCTTTMASSPGAVIDPQAMRERCPA
jgi:hypothetical protein